MAESELGVAVLRVVAKTDEAQAAIDALRQNIGRGFGDNRNVFASLEEGARQSVTRAGKILRDGAKGFKDIIDQAFKEKLSFGSVEAALEFKPGNTIKDLRDYSRALQDLADRSQIGAASTQQLIDRIGAVDGAIRRSSQTTAQANDIQRQFNASLQAASRIRVKEQAAPITPAAQRGTSEALQAAQASAPAVRRIRELLNSLTEPGPRFDVRNLEQIGAEAASAGVEISKFTRDILNGERALAVTRDGLRAQAQAYQTLAATVKVGTAEFTNYTQAAAKATQKDVFAGFDELKALRQLFDFGRAAGPKDGINLDSFRGSEELLKFASRVERTPAAISLYVQALEQAKSVTLTTSDNFQLLTAEIDRQRAALDAATRSAEAFSRIQQLTAEQRRQVGQAFIDASRAQAQLALPSSELLQQRVAQSGGSQPTRLQPGTTNLVNGEALRLAQQQLATDLQALSAKSGIAAEQAEINSLLGLGKRLLETTVDVINEQAQGYKFQTEQLQDQLAIQQQLRTLEAQRSKDARSRLAAEQSTRDNVDNARQRRLQKQREDDFDRRLGAVLSRRQDQQEVRRRVGDATGSALIGGAFPLLFGQGLGASIGGGIGGAAGGLLGGQFGFGLSLIGTAIGQFADDLRQRAGDLAEALRSPAANFETLKQNFIFASRSQEEYVKALLESGQTAKATAVIQNEASRTFDPAQANLLSGSTDRLNRSWSDLSDRLGNFVAGPATAFNDWLANIIKTVGGVPGQPQKVTGPSARQGAGNQSILGGATITAGLGLTAAALAAIPTGGLSLATLPAFAAALGLGTAGVATTGVGIGAVANAEDRRKIAVDPTTIAGEKALEAIKARQLALENQIVQAKLAGRTALVEQLNIEAKVTALNVQFAEAASKINQDRAAGKISAEEAVRLQNQLVEATRAQKIEIAAQAAASARTSAQQLKDAKALVGVYGTQRDILEEQQKVQAAQRTNDAAQAGLAAARARGATPEDLKIYENAARAAENNLLTVRVQAEEKIRQLETQRWADSIAAANKIAQIQRQTAITALQRDVGAPGIQALQALEQLRVARDAEREAQARLRVRPGDQALRDAADQAAEQTKAAAEQTRQTLIDAYTQAKDAARQIGRSIEDAANQLLRLQSGGDGLNAFLFGDARRQEQQTAFNALLPQFQQDRQTAAALYRSRGNESAALAFERLNFSGTLEQVNAQMLQFRQALQNQIRSEQDYQRLLPDGVRAQNALTTAEASLRGAGLTPQDTIPQLLTSLNELAQKKWNVTVNVDSKGNVQSFGDLLPSTF